MVFLSIRSSSDNSLIYWQIRNLLSVSVFESAVYRRCACNNDNCVILQYRWIRLVPEARYDNFIFKLIPGYKLHLSGLGRVYNELCLRARYTRYMIHSSGVSSTVYNIRSQCVFRVWRGIFLKKLVKFMAKFQRSGFSNEYLPLTIFPNSRDNSTTKIPDEKHRSWTHLIA